MKENGIIQALNQTETTYLWSTYLWSAGKQTTNLWSITMKPQISHLLQ